MDLPDKTDQLDLDNSEELSEDLLLNMLDEIQKEDTKVEKIPLKIGQSFLNLISSLYHRTKWTEINPLSTERPVGCFQCFSNSCHHISLRDVKKDIDQMLDNIVSKDCEHTSKINEDLCFECVTENFGNITIQDKEPIFMLWDAFDLVEYTSWIQDIDQMAFLGN